jgi:hypothetical protein
MRAVFAHAAVSVDVERILGLMFERGRGRIKVLTILIWERHHPFASPHAGAR